MPQPVFNQGQYCPQMAVCCACDDSWRSTMKGAIAMSDNTGVEHILPLGALGNVAPDGYTYRQKLVTPGQDLRLPNAYFKWYDIRLPELEITAEQDAESRAFLAAEVAAGRLMIDGELGF